MYIRYRYRIWTYLDNVVMSYFSDFIMYCHVNVLSGPYVLPGGGEAAWLLLAKQLLGMVILCGISIGITYFSV